MAIVASGTTGSSWQTRWFSSEIETGIETYSCPLLFLVGRPVGSHLRLKLGSTLLVTSGAAGLADPLVLI